MNPFHRSLQNRLRGRIVAIHRGDDYSEIDIDTAQGIVSAVLSSRTLERQRLRVGDETLALFRASEVTLAKLTDRSA